VNRLPVIILCGGLGTRLRSVVRDVPKVLAEINGRPFLAHVLERIRRQGFDHVYLSTGYLSRQIDDFVRQRPRDGLQIRCVLEDKPLGTAGALRYVWRAADLPAPLVVLNGDTFFSGDLSKIIDVHGTAQAAITLAAVQVPSADRYGIVRFEADTGEVNAFEEKGAGSGPAWINAGAYVVEDEVLQLIPEGHVSLEREILPAWVGRGLHVCPFPDSGFVDIGIPEDYTRAQHLLK